MEDNYCIKNATTDERCNNCPEYYCKNNIAYCRVIEDIKDEKIVLRCQECGTFRRRTESDKQESRNPTHTITCRECGAVLNYWNMIVKLNPDSV